MPTDDQLIDILGYLVTGSIVLLYSINRSFQKERRREREQEAYQQQIQELETTLRLYDLDNILLWEENARYKAMIKGQRSSIKEMTAQLNSVKTLHVNWALTIL